MSASSSGGGDNRPLDHNSSIGKVKKPSIASRSHNTDQDWTIKTSKKASQTKKVSNPTSPISPTLQQININTPVLNMSSSTFNYDISLSHSSNNAANNNMNIDSTLLHSTIDQANVPVIINSINFADSINTNIISDSNVMQSSRNLEQLNKHFSADTLVRTLPLLNIQMST
jgi:hypothetical protein